MRLAMIALGLALSAGCGVGCANTESATKSAAATNTLSSLRGGWTVTHLNGQLVTRPADLGARWPSLTVEDNGAVGGSAGVNHWKSTLDTAALKAGEFKLSPIASTMMAGSPAAMKGEQTYITLLSRARTIDQKQLAQGVLSLRDEGGEEVLRFRRGK
ncbi:MAG: META domain-containing protein [Planctomycetes bacterium]|nr:META domain-containing protein [Planctomycetota bacterium]